MAKVKWRKELSEPEPTKDFPVYEADGLPPVAPYWWRVNKMELITNKSGDDMFKVFCAIDEDESSSKSKYNHYFTVVNLNMTEEGKKFVMAFLQSVGEKWSSLMEDTVTDDEGRPTQVRRIGKANFTKGVRFRATTRRGSYQSEERLEIRWPLPLREKPKDEAEEAPAQVEDYDPETDGSLEPPPF